MASEYGYWLFANQNGLVGGPSTIEETPDGRKVIVKDPYLPAVLEDDYIVNILSMVPQARYDFLRLYPNLDLVSQDRLLNLINTHKRATALLRGDQAFTDMITRNSARSGVRTNLPRKEPS